MRLQSRFLIREGMVTGGWQAAERMDRGMVMVAKVAEVAEGKVWRMIHIAPPCEFTDPVAKDSTLAFPL